MAVHMQTPKPTNWWLWGGAAVAAIVVIAALGYGLDWFGSGITDEMTPGPDLTAPSND